MACLLPLWAQEHSNKPTHGQFKKTATIPFFYQSREIVRRNTISNSNIFQWIENVIDELEKDRSSRRLWRRLPGRLLKNRFARGFLIFCEHRSRTDTTPFEDVSETCLHSEFLVSRYATFRHSRTLLKYTVRSGNVVMMARSFDYGLGFSKRAEEFPGQKRIWKADF